VARTVAAPAVVGRNVFAAAGAGLRDLIIPESLANAITGNISLNLNMNLGLNPWGGAGAGEGPRMSPTRMREKAEKLREELDLLLASGCPLCESVVAGLDKPFVVPGESDRSWDL
jgi:vacuolar protein sorting-associated protein 18